MRFSGEVEELFDVVEAENVALRFDLGRHLNLLRSRRGTGVCHVRPAGELATGDPRAAVQNGVLVDERGADDLGVVTDTDARPRALPPWPLSLATSLGSLRRRVGIGE